MMTFGHFCRNAASTLTSFESNLIHKLKQHKEFLLRYVLMINIGIRENLIIRRLSLIIDGMKGTTITEMIIMEEIYNTGKKHLFSVNTDLEEIYLLGAEIHINGIVNKRIELYKSNRITYRRIMKRPCKW